jgi:hypothetical protein
MLALFKESYFKGYFTTKTIFTPSLFKASSLLLILSAILLFVAPYFGKRFYRLSPNLPKHFGISKSTFSPPSTSMKYEDAMKVLRKMRHHFPQDLKIHLDEETEESLHLHHFARWLLAYLQSTSFPTIMLTRSSFSWIGIFSGVASFLLKLENKLIGSTSLIESPVITILLCEDRLFFVWCENAWFASLFEC